MQHRLRLLTTRDSLCFFAVIALPLSGRLCFYHGRVKRTEFLIATELTEEFQTRARRPINRRFSGLWPRKRSPSLARFSATPRIFGKIWSANGFGAWAGSACFTLISGGGIGAVEKTLQATSLHSAEHSTGDLPQCISSVLRGGPVGYLRFS